MNQKRKKGWVKEYVSRKWSNWYQNEVDKEIKGVSSREKVQCSLICAHPAITADTCS